MYYPVAALALWTIACGSDPPGPTLLDPPSRAAVEDARLRRLLVAVAETQLCTQLRGSFVALPDADAAQGAAGGASPSAGRLWIRECTTENRDGRLALRLSGPGWTWVEQTSDGPLGSSFTVRGHLRFLSEIELAGELDIGYAEEQRLVSLWLTPRDAARAHISPVGAVAVEPEGGWSAFLGAVGGVFGDSVEERAGPMIEEQGSAQMAERLSRGFTFTVDLCSGQSDSMVGPLGNGETPSRPYAADGLVWLANQRVRLRGGGLDASGPFSTGTAPLHVDYEVEAGNAVEIAAYCEDAAARMIEGFLQEREPEDVRALARHRVVRGAPTFFEVDTGDCPVVVLARVLEEDTAPPTVFRFRAYAQGHEPTPLIRCE
jgi:hypothetical protein